MRVIPRPAPARPASAPAVLRRVLVRGIAAALVAIPGWAAAPPPASAASEPATAAAVVAPGLDASVLRAALAAWEAARADGMAGDSDLLTVIDYGLPSSERRLWVIDLGSGRTLFHELVAHGRGSGMAVAERFSNEPGSRATCLGLFRTGAAYEGAHGLSLRLHGLEEGVNDRAFERAIVMHGAWYVSDELAARQGRIGRSLGCPALREEIARDVIDTIAGGSLLFAWHPEPRWRARSASQACDEGR